MPTRRFWAIRRFVYWRGTLKETDALYLFTTQRACSAFVNSAPLGERRMQVSYREAVQHDVAIDEAGHENPVVADRRKTDAPR